ncbi:hypothetical protein CTI12_AA212030 [Artemisia annua]|uniref:Proteinase inhibitor I13 n=1 Tax=Artemisia annua TaxID=35608 RepID=A0A2U1NS03_ARTAN|nr:hypothetical protein CTI12_AA212030 [Artemisia annua]
MSFCQGKSCWPELVGAKGEDAAATIERENPGVHAIVLLEGSPITFDFSCGRVWVFVDSCGIVIQTPRIG